jgi:EmrB/QacA subfamily drug resistance transporter
VTDPGVDRCDDIIKGLRRNETESFDFDFPDHLHASLKGSFQIQSYSVALCLQLNKLNIEGDLAERDLKPIRSITEPCAEGVIRAAPSFVPCPPHAAPWILAATIMGSSMAFIDSSVVNLALPALQANLNATVIAVQWVVESYALLLAALMLVGGSLGDNYGRKRVYVWGVVLFAMASAWCGLAPNISQLIIARGVQGVGAALLVPGSLAIISASFDKRDRGRAIGTWSGFTSMTAAVGPVLGGFLIEYGSWRWAFFINLPLAVVVLALTIRYVPESRNVQEGATLDWVGAGLATVGLGSLVYALIESSSRSWSDSGIIAAFSCGVAALAAFFIVEVYSTSPLLPLSLFRSRDFSAVNLVTLFLYGALTGLLFFLPLNLIQVQGYSATAAGASMLPFILLMSLLSRWSGGLVDRYGPRLPLVVGPVIVAIGFVLFTFPRIGGAYWTTFFPAVVVLGLGMATSVAPLTTTVMNSVSEAHVGAASGINNAVSRLAGLLSIAVFGIIMLAGFNRHLSSDLSALNLEPGIRHEIDDQRSRLAAIEVPQSVGTNLRAEIRQSIDNSFVAGFRLVMLTAAGLAVLSAATAWVTIKRKL